MDKSFDSGPTVQFNPDLGLLFKLLQLQCMVEAEQTSDPVSTETGTSAQPLTPDGLSWLEVQVDEEKQYKICHVDVALESPKGSKGTSVFELLKIRLD